MFGGGPPGGITLGGRGPPGNGGCIMIGGGIMGCGPGKM